jgi:tetratricopeptide (TPR) repeat protein
MCAHAPDDPAIRRPSAGARREDIHIHARARTGIFSLAPAAVARAARTFPCARAGTLGAPSPRSIAAPHAMRTVVRTAMRTATATPRCGKRACLRAEVVLRSLSLLSISASVSLFLSPLVVLSASPFLVACDGTSPTPAPTAEPAKAAVSEPQKADPAKSAEADRHFQRALELEASGQYPEARSEVDLALAAGAGRDAKLLAAKLAILRDDLDAALRLLEPLASAAGDPGDAGDALVLYNLGLIAQRRGEYNNARTRYLAAIKADPTYTPARYNLAVLTFDAGVKDEAQHHARKFLELAPGDPLAGELRTRILGEAPPALDGAPAPTEPPADRTAPKGDKAAPKGDKAAAREPAEPAAR